MRFGFSAYLIAFCLGELLIACSANNFVYKKVYIKGSNPLKDIKIQVPRDCAKFVAGLKTSLVAIGELDHSNNELVRNNYEKINIVNEYSSRMYTICLTQCNLVATTNIIDPNISDYYLYTKLLENYTEYQKIKDLLDKNISTYQNDIITESALKIYNNLYDTRKDSIMNGIEDLRFDVDAPTNSKVFLYVNNSFIAKEIPNEDNIASFILPRKYLIPKPNETNKIKIKVEFNNGQEQESRFPVGALLKYSKDLEQRNSNILNFMSTPNWNDGDIEYRVSSCKLKGGKLSISLIVTSIAPSQIVKITSSECRITDDDFNLYTASEIISPFASNNSYISEKIVRGEAVKLTVVFSVNRGIKEISFFTIKNSDSPVFSKSSKNQLKIDFE